MLMISLNHIITPQPPINLPRTLSFSPTTNHPTRLHFFAFSLPPCTSSLSFSLWFVSLSTRCAFPPHYQSLSGTFCLCLPHPFFISTLSGTFCFSKYVCWDCFFLFCVCTCVCVHTWFVLSKPKDSSFLFSFFSEFIWSSKRFCPPFVLGTFLIKLIGDWMNLVTCLSRFHFSFSLQYIFRMRFKKEMLSQMWMCVCFFKPSRVMNFIYNSVSS